MPRSSSSSKIGPRKPHEWKKTLRPARLHRLEQPPVTRYEDPPEERGGDQRRGLRAPIVAEGDDVGAQRDEIVDGRQPVLDEAIQEGQQVLVPENQVHQHLVDGPQGVESFEDGDATPHDQVVFALFGDCGLSAPRRPADWLRAAAGRCSRRRPPNSRTGSSWDAPRRRRSGIPTRCPRHLCCSSW